MCATSTVPSASSRASIAFEPASEVSSEGDEAHDAGDSEGFEGESAALPLFAAPTAAVGLEGELGNQQELPSDIFQGTVHGMLFIRKNSQLDNLLSQLSSSFLAITFSYPKENQHPGSDRADDLPIDLNRGGPDSLK